MEAYQQPKAQSVPTTPKAADNTEGSGVDRQSLRREGWIMSEDVAAEAERRLDEALAESGARDPRELYRARLRELKRMDPDEYAQAVEYYREVLLPQVASDAGDPLLAWTEYGRRLATALAPGRTVCIDGSGRARPYQEASRQELILHLPDAKGSRALLVGLPDAPSAAQRATYDVLVAGKQRSSE